jgi:four helix bundle protein
LSIANNVVEGSGRRSKAEKSRFWSFAQSSAFECVPLLTILHDRKYIIQGSYKTMYDECFQISKMLSGLMKTAK